MLQSNTTGKLRVAIFLFIGGVHSFTKGQALESLLSNANRLRHTRPVQAFEYAKAAARKARTSKNLFALARANELQASLARLLQDLKTAETCAQSALLYYRAKKMYGNEANCLLLIAQNISTVGNLAETERYLRQAERLVRKSKAHPDILARAIGIRALLKLDQGLPTQALPLLFKCLSICERFNLKREKGNVLHSLATFYFLQGQYEQSLSYSFRAIAILRVSKDNYTECYAVNLLGATYSLKNDSRNAMKCFLRANSLATRIGTAHLLVWSRCNLIEQQIKNGNGKAATASVRKLIRLQKTTSDILSRISIYSTAASFYLALKQPSQAIKLFRMALKLSESFPFQQLQLLESLVGIYMQYNDAKHALSALKEYLILKDQLIDSKSAEVIESLKVNSVRKDGTVTADELLETYSQHRLEKNEFIHSLKKMGEQQKISDPSVLHQIDRDIPTDAFDHELYIRLTYNDFMNRLSKRFPLLSSTELKIATLLRLQMPSKKIASLLSISVRTIEFHRTNIRRKMKLKSKDNLNLVLMKI